MSRPASLRLQWDKGWILENVTAQFGGIVWTVYNFHKPNPTNAEGVKPAFSTSSAYHIGPTLIGRFSIFGLSEANSCVRQRLLNPEVFLEWNVLEPPRSLPWTT